MPVDQSLAAVPSDPAARDQRRRQVTAGAYVLRRAAGTPTVTIAVMGALVGQALAAAERLEDQGPADRRRRGHEPRPALPRAAGPRRGHGGATPRRRPGSSTPRSPPTAPRRLVTVLDGHPHTLAFLASVHGVRASHLGVTDFGRSSDLADAWAHHHIDTDAIVAAALA